MAKYPDTSKTDDYIKEARLRMSGSAKQIDKKVAEVPYMSVNEPAIVHPWNNSVMKIRDNGAIDVFSGTDNGIRINPVDRTIDMISKTNNTHATIVRAFVMKDETHYVKNVWTIYADTAFINTKKNTTINTGWNTIVNAEKQCVINTKDETIVNADKNIELNTKKDFHMKAAGNAYYQAGGQHFFT